MLLNSRFRHVSSACREGGHPAASAGRSAASAAAAVVPVPSDDGINAYLAGCRPALTITLLAEKMSERQSPSLG
jgi:hypothetical protein